MRSHCIRIIASLIVVAVVLATGGASTAAEPPARPNIILLMGDDHGWEETGYHGHPDLKTPVLDEMAATGLRLDRFYSGHPSCSPTRGSVLTGRHPNRYGTFSPGYSLRPEEITIAHLLGKAGYLRGHFGKWHVGTVKAGSPTNPGAMGFDEWVSHDNFFELNPPLSRNGGPPKIHEGESSAVVIDETLRFIEKAEKQEQPFLAVVWFGSPHEPYSGLPEDLALYDDLPKKYADRDPVSLTSNETGRRVTRPLGEVLRERYAEITAMDRAIGKLREFLKSKGLRDNTLIWYCGDNGTPSSGVLASPLRGRKGQVYEGGTRVPAVIEWPARIAKPRVSETNAVTSDMLPTLCALAGAPVPTDRSLDGINLVPLLDGDLRERSVPIFFWSFDSRQRLKANPKPWIDPKWQEGTTPLVKLMGGIATRNFRNYHHPDIVESDFNGARVMLGDRHKLVIHDRGGDGDPGVELFDLRVDPAEKTNLAESEPAIVKNMQTELRTWQQSVLESLTGADYAQGPLDANVGEETISLFDGKTLNGWVTLDGKPVTSGWEVIDGAIHVKIGKERSGHIKTTRTFENFDLEFEWRVAEGGNSGVKYLTKESDSDRGRGYYGCEYQLLDDTKHKNGRTPTKTAGSLYDLYAPAADQKRLKPPGEYNHSRIVVAGGQIEHWLNGRKIVEATIGSEDWRARFKKSKVSSVKDFAVGPGVILLQEHLSEAWFRNIRITPLASKRAEVNGKARQHGTSPGFEALVEKTHAASLQVRERVLRDTVARETSWPNGVWGEVLWSLAALYLNEKVDEVNARLLKRANEYIALRRANGEISNFLPEEATETPWAYFALTDYVRILALFHAKSSHFPGRLTAETEAAMKEALWFWVKSESKVSGASLDNLLVLLGTENHDLTRRPNHYLISSILKDDPAFRERRYNDGHTASEHAAAYTTFFLEWPRKRAATGLWIEIGSNGYQKYSWPALFNLHELAPDPVVRKRFGMLLDLALIEEAQISVRGRRGGGRSRAEGGRNGFESYKNLLYAPEGQPAMGSHSNVIETSRYQAPAAAVLLRMRAFPAAAPFAIRNRVLGEREPARPEDGQGNRFAADSALVNYAWRTPHYLLGSTLQNPSLTMPHSDPDSDKPDWKYGGISRQKRSCGMLFDDPASEEVSAVYPVIEKTGGGRPQHPFWSVQHENVILLQRIAPQTRKGVGSYSTGKIGIRFDGSALRKVEEKGWIFASNQKAFIGVKFLDGDFLWDEDRAVAYPAGFEHKTDTSRILLHAGDLNSHPSFEAFRRDLLDNEITVTANQAEYEFGSNPDRIDATLLDGERLEDFALPRINAQPINLHPSNTYQSPYLNGKFGDDRIAVTVGPVHQILEFALEKKPRNKH